MYNSPFGSIFGQEEAPKPQAKTPPITEQQATPKQATPKQQPPTQSVQLMREMKERTEAVEKEKVYKPKAKKKPRGKLFDKTLPQFQAKVEITHRNPVVRNEQAQFALDKTVVKYQSLRNKLLQLKKKHQAARLYSDMLLHYARLEPKDRKAVNKWISKHLKAIKKVGAARKLKKIAAEAREAAHALDVEVKHLENLNRLKEKGINIKGARKLKNYRPKGRAFRPWQEAAGAIPKFKGEVPTEEIVRLGKKNVPQVQGYGEDEGELPPKNRPKKEKDVVVTREMAQELHKKGKFEELLAKDLKSRRYYLNQRRKRRKNKKLEEAIEEALLEKKQVEWQLEKLENKLEAEQNAYEETQEGIAILIDELKEEQAISGDTVTALAILSEAQPEKFVAAETLLQGIKYSFRYLSNLDGYGQLDLDASPEDKTDIALANAAQESEEAIRELESRQNALAQMQAKLEDKPAPPPITTPTPKIIIEVKKVIEEESKTESTLKKVSNALPLILGGILLYHLFFSGKG